MRPARFFFASAFVVTRLLFIGQIADAQQLPSGLDPNTFEARVRVQDDLYRAVNGRWLDQTEIPADRSNYGSFSILDDLSQERIREIIEAAAQSDHPPGSDLQKVADFYRSFMYEDQVNALGVAPIRGELARIDAISSYDELVRYFGYAQTVRVDVPLAISVSQDDKDSTRNAVVLVHSGTTLPDRDYYLKDDEKYQATREALAAHVDQLFELAGLPVESAGQQVLALEKALAGVQWERTELRDADKRYNKYIFHDLAGLAPELQWSKLFESAEIPSQEYAIVTAPSFFEGLNTILKETPLDVWKQYLRFKLIDSVAPYLSQPFVDAHFNLHQRVITGVPQQKPRWKRGVELISGAGAGDFGALGDVVGRAYVDAQFGPEAKARMMRLVQNLLVAFDQSIGELAWMTDTTKARARDKLAKINTKIGYPNTWRDYTELEVAADDLFGNIRRSAQVEHRRMINKLGKPIDRDEWGMTPQTVNAYYNPSMNEIVFPAAILQPPFFDPNADDAVNYGGIGAVIGHEISHAFDDQGSKYDGDGNLNNWWNAKDRQAFKELTSRLVDQYSQYMPLEGKHVNGQLTLGENIADLSGLAIAYKAYHLSLNGQTAPVIDGWTGDQRLFLGWSQIWRRKYRAEEMVRRLLTDPHSPSWYRANGPVINIDAFYDAFNITSSDELFRPPAERIRIW